MSPSTSILDHIVHLNPPGTLDVTVAHFENLGFNVIQGGTHADGLTSNALVILGDGAYLELLNFVKPASAYPPGSPERKLRDTHPWASKAPGWIDFAFLGTGDDQDKFNKISEIINSRSKIDGSGVEYLAEVPGGRETPQGKVLKWLITSPANKHGRGVLPFFCGDVTPREWRVPISNEPREHPSSAKGIAHIVLLAASEDLDELSRQITTVIGALPVNGDTDELSWSLDTINNSLPTKLHLRAERSKEEQGMLRPGSLAKIYEVGFWVDADRGRGPSSTPYGRIVWLPVGRK